ncbi:DNA adenine methylase [Fibrella forsythiae]|uniref:DNA adenine methylase n=1 Tax=Fibrella forsythiae TaxID=2817061 RepID=A0ABS3JLI6_9BACT|nr:DNA adenine methylase [Fibrella forsythiae]MBO0950876.1 DNA adenine methylase [Fibrella forsythiae]
MQTAQATLPGPYESYYGGKGASGAAQTIINHIRPHATYMELFVGNGTVFRCKKPATTTILNDLNNFVFDDWRSTGFEFMNSTIDFWNRDATDILATYQFQGDLQYCVYLDPPYPISSRSEGKERYECEMTDDDHRELLNVLRYLPDNVDVLISTYKNPIYAELLHDWHLVTFQAMTRRGPATEYLYMNYVPDGRLHDYRYLGADRTDRQRIRRKIRREIARLKNLPVAERNAIINAVSQLR